MVTPLPGAVGVSGLRVYDWQTADGVCGGSPHVHLTCAECYVVVEGTGHVQTLTHRGFAETALRPGTVAWFTPGTIHRLVNDGGLRIVVVMQNSGLPEAGDAVFTFPPETLIDPHAYAKAATVGDEEAARRRRDLAIEGFVKLRRQIDDGEYDQLIGFYRAAVRLKRDALPEWELRWAIGALASAHDTGRHLQQLRGGDFGHLVEAEIRVLEPPDERRLGMCGWLDTYDPTAGTSPYD